MASKFRRHECSLDVRNEWQCRAEGEKAKRGRGAVLIHTSTDTEEDNPRIGSFMKCFAKCFVLSRLALFLLRMASTGGQ